MSFRSKGRNIGGGGNGPAANLDDLMMSYADLNSNNKNGRGFKGPPVKDIKQIEVKAAKFEPSTKARDWKTLDQNLESAFTVPTPSNGIQYQPASIINPVGDVGQFFNANENPAPPAQRSIIDDDWGDFQGFSTPPAFNVSNNVSYSNQKQPSSLNISYNSTNWASQSPLPNSNTFSSNNHNSLPIISPQTNINHNSSFTVSSQPVYSPAAPVNNWQNNALSSSKISSSHVNHNGQATMTSPLDTDIKSIAKESVGCRLASFQEESPVHRFKSVANNVGSVMDDIDDDFGDFTGGTTNTSNTIPVVQQTQSISLPPSINIQPLVSSQNSPAPYNALTPAPAKAAAASSSQQDKYSALRDLFSSTSSDTVTADIPKNDITAESQTIENDLHNLSSDNLINNSNLSRYSLSPMPPNGVLNTSSEQLMTSHNVLPPATGLLAPSPTAGLFNTSSDQLVNNASFNNSISNSFTPVTNNTVDFLSMNNSFETPKQNIYLPPKQKDLLPIKDIASKLATTTMGNKMPVKIEDDFGDFVEPGFGNTTSTNMTSGSVAMTDDFDEWSLPSTTPMAETIKPAQPLPIKTFGVTMTKSGTAASLPYFSSSPPLHCSSPPPIDPVAVHTVDLEFELPSEQLKLPDKVVFGISQPAKKESTNVKKPPSSLTDILQQQLEQKTASENAAVKNPNIDVRLASIDQNAPKSGFISDEWKQDDVFISAEENENHKKSSLTTTTNTSGKSSSRSPDSPQSLRLPSISPDGGSIASLEFDTENKLSIGDNGKRSINNDNYDLVDSWLDILAEIENIFSAATRNYKNIESNDVKINVLKSDACLAYLQNLAEVYLVFSRVKHSAKVKSLGNQEMSNQFSAVEKSMKDLLSETNNHSVLSNATERFLPGDDNAPRICGICLTSTVENGGRVSSHVIGQENGGNGHLIVYNGAEYHAGCANFWVNCINSSLISLVEHQN